MNWIKVMAKKLSKVYDKKMYALAFKLYVNSNDYNKA